MLDLSRVESAAMYRAERRRLRAARHSIAKPKRLPRFVSKLRRRITTGNR